MLADPNYSLICAVRRGDLNEVQKLINSFGLSYSPAWSGGYVLLREAIREEHTAVARLLLLSGSRVNSKSKCPTDTPLHYAVENNNVELVNMLLDRCANVHARNHDGKTPLHHAAVSGNVQITERLLNRGACVNITVSSSREKGYTPLHYASAQGHGELVKLLLDKGADINARTKNHKYTALHIAVERSHKEVVTVLLKYEGCDINARDERGNTALLIAIQSGKSSTIEHILELLPEINDEDNRSCLHKALCDREVCREVVEILLKYGFTVHSEDAKNCNLLHAAVQNGYLKIIEDLLRYGADVNSLHQSNTLLHKAADHKQIEAAKLLINYGADVNAKAENGEVPITYAIKHNDVTMTKLLLSSGASIKVHYDLLHNAVRRNAKEMVEIILRNSDVDINAKDRSGLTALHYAVLDGLSLHLKENNPDSVIVNRSMTELLLSQGADVNVETKDGLTPLQVAAKCGNANAVGILLEYNAKVNFAAKCKKTPLHYNAKEGSEIVTRMLLDKGAKVNAKDENGQTPLHAACENCHEEVVVALLESGVEIDARNNEDASPLQIAVAHGSVKIVKNLLKRFAEIECKDKSGRTALHIASKHGWTEVVEELLDHGADINVTCQKGNTPLDYANDTGLFPRAYNGQRQDRGFDYGERFQYESEDDDYYGYPDECEDDYSDSDRDYYHDHFDDGRSHTVTDILMQYIAKMKALNLYVSRQNLEMVNFGDEHTDFGDEHKDFEVDCRYEAKMMKKEKIGDTNVSFHDLLTKGMYQLAIYARNESIVEVLESGCYKEKFPIYANMIYNNFKRGQKRETLLNSSLTSLNFLSGFVLPELASVELLNHLSNKDLENLIKAVPNTDSNETTS